MDVALCGTSMIEYPVIEVHTCIPDDYIIEEGWFIPINAENNKTADETQKQSKMKQKLRDL